VSAQSHDGIVPDRHLTVSWRGGVREIYATAHADWVANPRCRKCRVFTVLKNCQYVRSHDHDQFLAVSPSAAGIDRIIPGVRDGDYSVSKHWHIDTEARVFVGYLRANADWAYGADKLIHAAKAHATHERSGRALDSSIHCTDRP
jgi:hypothetical protein